MPRFSSFAIPFPWAVRLLLLAVGSRVACACCSGRVPWYSLFQEFFALLQPSYTPTAMNYDFALVTLKNAASASAGYMGMTVGQGIVTMNLTTAGYPVSLHIPQCCTQQIVAPLVLQTSTEQEPFHGVKGVCLLNYSVDSYSCESCSRPETAPGALAAV